MTPLACCDERLPLEDVPARSPQRLHRADGLDRVPEDGLRLERAGQGRGEVVQRHELVVACAQLGGALLHAHLELG
jgi:hypothetical protein